uniref:Carbohydrate sulfotransferase n=2 Tax=Vombatus ursinus TaxID=29139 RepID=A0A4X2KDT8_VOMUR
MGQLSYKLYCGFGLCLLLLWICCRQLETPTTDRETISTDTSDHWQLTQQLRQEQLSTACKKRGLWKSDSQLVPKQVARQLLVERNHRLLFCEVPKAGCSNWRRVLLLLALNLSRWDPAEVAMDRLHTTSLLQRLNSFQPRECDLMLKHYTPVLVTRHPLERLVSAYRDKLLHSEPYYMHVADKIRTAVRGSRAPKNQRNLTFPEFVTFILRQPPADLDVHWKPIALLCSPCSVRYGVLIWHENMSSEAEQALRFLGIPSPGLFPSAKVHQSEKRTDDQLTRHYLGQLSPEQLSGLYNLYFLDFTLFGYHIQNP